MNDILLSLLAGMVLGITFTYLKLPLPAPISFAGIVGIFGVWLGYIITK